MATAEDVRRICRRLPGSLEGPDGLGFAVLVKGKTKGYCWTWNERIHPKKPKAPNPNVLAVMVPNLQAKELILASDTGVYFTEDHYNGFPAVLVRIPAISVAELEPLLMEAWACKAPRDVVAEFLGR